MLSVCIMSVIKMTPTAALKLKTPSDPAAPAAGEGLMTVTTAGE